MRKVSQQEQEVLLAIARREHNARRVRAIWAAQSERPETDSITPEGPFSLVHDVIGPIAQTPLGAFRVVVTGRDTNGDLRAIDYIPLAAA